MKKAQLSTAVAVFLIVVVLILAAIALTVILVTSTDNDFMGKYVGKYPQKMERYEEKYYVNYNTPQEPQVMCSTPYIKVGLTCCLDKNYNSICDNDEQTKTEPEYTNMCESPYRSIGGKCCVDDDRNGRCDYDEDYSRDERTYATLSRPFSLYSYLVEEDEIRLSIKNREDYTVTILKIEIDDCDDNTDETTLKKDERERFTFDCDRDKEFDRDITVTYVVEGSTDEQTVTGRVEREIRTRSYRSDYY